MRIACFFIGWNIEPTIAQTVNHYKQFCETVVFLDNYSEDFSREMAKILGATCSKFGIPEVLDDGEYIKVKNNVWKGLDHDYVIICDDDEILYHPELPFILEQEKALGTTIFKTQGYGMYSNEMPVDSWLDIKTGIPDDNYSKCIIFDPKAIKEIGYVYGSHACKPTGRLQWSHTTLPILHYHYVGGIERVIARHREYEPRRQRSTLNMKWNLGHTYAAEHEQETRKNFDECLKRSGPLYLDGRPLFPDARPGLPEKG